MDTVLNLRIFQHNYNFLLKDISNKALQQEK